MCSWLPPRNAVITCFSKPSINFVGISFNHPKQIGSSNIISKLRTDHKSYREINGVLRKIGSKFTKISYVSQRISHMNIGAEFGSGSIPLRFSNMSSSLGEKDYTCLVDQSRLMPPR